RRRTTSDHLDTKPALVCAPTFLDLEGEYVAAGLPGCLPGRRRPYAGKRRVQDQAHGGVARAELGCDVHGELRSHVGIDSPDPGQHDGSFRVGAEVGAVPEHGDALATEWNRRNCGIGWTARGHRLHRDPHSGLEPE